MVFASKPKITVLTSLHLA